MTKIRLPTDAIAKLNYIKELKSELEYERNTRLKIESEIRSLEAKIRSSKI